MINSINKSTKLIYFILWFIDLCFNIIINFFKEYVTHAETKSPVRDRLVKPWATSTILTVSFVALAEELYVGRRFIMFTEGSTAKKIT